MKWFILFLLLPAMAQAAELDSRKSIQHFDLPCGSKKVSFEFSVPSGTDLEVHLNRSEKCSDGSKPFASADVGLKAGVYSGGGITPFVSPTIGLSVKISDRWFLRGMASVGLATSGSVSDFGIGLGMWATDHLRLTATVGQVVRRTASWSWYQGGPTGKVAADYFIGTTKLFVSAEAFGGPSWDRNGQLSPAFGGALGLGWRF